MAITVSTKRSKFGIKLFLLAGLFFSCCLWLLFTYRVPLLIFGFNQWANQHDLKIISVGELRLGSGVLVVSNAQIRQNHSQLALTNLAVSFSSGFQPSDFSIEELSVDDISLTLDYDSLLSVRANYSSEPAELGPDEPIGWADMPNVKVSRLELELIGFPLHIVPAALNQANIVDFKFSPLNIAEISMALSLGQRPKDQQPLVDVAATYQDHHWQGNIEMALADSLPLIDSLIPQSLNAMALSGQLSLDFVLSLTNTPSIDITAAIDNLTVVDRDVDLLHSVDLTAHSTLTLSDVPRLSPIATSFTQRSALHITKAYCEQAIELLNKDLEICELLTDIEYVSVLAASPLEIIIDIDLSEPANWQVAAPSAEFEVETADERFQVLLASSSLSVDKFDSNWLVEGTSKRIPFAKDNAFSIKGKLTKTQDITLTVKDARLSLQQLKLNDAAIDNVQVSNSHAIDIVIVDGEIPDIESMWSSNIEGINFRDLAISNVEADHQIKLSTKQLRLQSTWQVDDLQLTSFDSITLNNYRPQTASGQWQLPEQAMTAVLAIRNPLPPALSLNATIQNVIEYQSELSAKQFRVDAEIIGLVKADNGAYHDIKLRGLDTKWQCKFYYVQKMQLDCDVSGQLAELDVGIALTKLGVHANLSSNGQNLRLELSQAGGNILGGSFSVQPLVINDLNEIKARLELNRVSLEQIVELQQQQGVKVTGLLKGTLPIGYHDNQLTVTDGHIENHPPGGVIKIQGNETVNQLRLSQPQLTFVLDALEDLRYSHLASSINYQADGEMLLKVIIHGRNPDIERPIEFNYSHQENLIQLLRSLRIGDEISKQIEKIAD